METRIERKRGRLFRFIAWTLSLAIHLLILYVVMVGLDSKEAAPQDVAAVKTTIKISK